MQARSGPCDERLASDEASHQPIWRRSRHPASRATTAAASACGVTARIPIATSASPLARNVWAMAGFSDGRGPSQVAASSPATRRAPQRLAQQGSSQQHHHHRHYHQAAPQAPAVVLPRSRATCAEVRQAGGQRVACNPKAAACGWSPGHRRSRATNRSSCRRPRR